MGRGWWGWWCAKKKQKKQQQRASPQATLCPPHVWKYLNVFLIRILSYGRMFNGLGQGTSVLDLI